MPVMSISPNTSHAGEFEALQEEAYKWQRGIWADPLADVYLAGEKTIKSWNF